MKNYRILLTALSALAVVGCADNVNPDVPLVEREKEPVVFEGSGNLCYVGDDESDVEIETSTYTWSAHDDVIEITADIDLTEYKERGAYEIGHFTLPASTIAEFLGGVSVMDLDESTFYAVTPGGEKTDFTSYKPGMWLTDTGEGCGWSDGSAFWQWYVWGGKGETYDWDYNNHMSMFVLGGNPSNTPNNMPGKSLRTEARIVANGQTYRLVITYNFSELEKSIEKEGPLQAFEYDDDWNIVGQYDLNSRYYYKISETSILLDFTIDTEEYLEIGDWEIGHFAFPMEELKEMMGFDPATLTEDSFYPIDAFGEPSGDFTSHKPGMWIDAKGEPTDYSGGAAYWQWYIWGGKTDKNGEVIGYDNDYNEYPGLFVIGSNPGNVSKITYDETFGSYAIMEANGNKYDITVNYTFSEHVLPPEGEGYQNVPMYAGNGELAYSSGVDGDHQWFWAITEEGLNVDVTAYLPAIIEEGAWEFTGMVIPTAELESAGVDISRLTDLEYFYPLSSTGEKLTEWTSYVPGEWVDAAGDASDWSAGCLFYQYQFDAEHMYDGHFTEGLLVIGCNPDNAAAVADQTVTCKAMMGELPITINVTYVSAYPTALTYRLNGNSLSWELTDSAVNVNAECSLATFNDSWNWFGMVFNEKYINAYYNIDIDEVSADIEQFYPVASDGTAYSSWSSYEPGEWFDAEGNEAAWDTGWSFWQYYTHSTYDYDIPNLLLLGNNCAPAIFTVGQTVTSKARMNGVDWNVTLKIVE